MDQDGLNRKLQYRDREFRLPVIRLFFLLFIPFTLAYMPSVFFIYTSLAKSHAEEGLQQDGQEFDALTRVFERTVQLEMQMFMHDLIVLRNEEDFLNLLSENTPETRGVVEREWISISKSKQIYDQIRWIDNNGREKIRINFNHGDPVSVPAEGLQDKSQRYYFTEILKMGREDIYVSPLDLNVDRGAIESPVKPVFRLGVRVFDKDGESKGILVLNFLARTLLGELEHLDFESGRKLWLLDQSGYWLVGPSEGLEWGFMFDRPGARFQVQYPHAWQKIASASKGQFEDGSISWLFSTVYPLTDGNDLKRHSHADLRSRSTVAQHHNYLWKIVSRGAFDPTASMTFAGNKTLIRTSVVLFLLLTSGLWLFAHTRVRRKQAESDLKAIGLMYRTVADFTYDWETWTDNQGDLLYCSPACERVSGYSAAEFMENPELLNEIVHEDDLEAFENHFHEAEVGRGADDLLFRIHDRNGELRWIEHICQPVTDEQGRVTGRRASNRDVTARKRYEEEVVDARRSAEVANHAKSIFLANMSHEIRTPLNAVIGFTHLVKETSQEPEQISLLGKIENAAGHLLSVINDILDFSKIEAGRMTLEKATFQLSAVIGQVGQLSEGKSGGVTFGVHVDDNVPEMLLGDATRLRQALLNYVSNAYKFTEKGTVELTVKQLDEQEGRVHLKFEVKDTGMGIPPEQLQTLFSAFKQADDSTTRKHGGTGLGLAITRYIVGLMGGKCGVESELGLGSTFWFTAWFGRGEATDESAPVPSGTEPDPAGQLRVRFEGSRILLAEDNLINQEVARRLLLGVGLVVDTVENGREALESLRDGNYDLVLMDVQMPEMDGLEATRAIRALPGYAQLPIIAMTANVFNEDKKACLDAGMDDFVGKPVVPENLFGVLLEHLGRSL